MTAATAPFVADFVDQTKAARTLGAALRPTTGAGLTHLPNTHSAVLWDLNERDAAAFACVQRYAPDKAYVCVSAVTAALAGRPVRSAPSERLPPGLATQCKAATVTAVKETERDVFKGPMWKTNFVRKTRTPEETVLEMALIDALGSYDLELTKNATIDLIEQDKDTLREQLNVWRDKVGFIVTDSRDYYEVTVPSAAALLAELTSATGGAVAAYPVTATFSDDDLTFYDKRVTGCTRDDYLRLLRQMPGAVARMAHAADGGNIPCGEALALNNGTLMHMYAESDAVAVAMFANMVKDMTSKSGALTFCAPADSLLYRIAADIKGVQVHRVHRFHTTGVPTGIKWENVYAFNCGVNIV